MRQVGEFTLYPVFAEHFRKLEPWWPKREDVSSSEAAAAGMDRVD